MEFCAHRFLFKGRVEGNILLGERKGSAVRGAFNEVVRQHCENRDIVSCRACPLVSQCPVSHLVSPVDDGGRRGADVPRPYTVEPPLDERAMYQEDDPFEFGVTLFGRGIQQLRIVLGGLTSRNGLRLGRRVVQANQMCGQGALRVQEVIGYDPIDGREAAVMHMNDRVAHVPDFGVTHEAVLRRAGAMAQPERVTVHFLTPTRLIEQGRLVQRPLFRPLFQRLVERLSSLWEQYAGASPPLDFASVMAAAEQVRTVEDATRWVELESYSSRRNVRTPIGGFVGLATFEGPLAPLLPWLIWGEYTHVGKNAVKGDGWYRLEMVGADV